MPSPLRHVILPTFGTDGDVFPFVGLGAALRRRGHEVTLASIERYRPLAVRLGLGFEAITTNAETDRITMHPDFWHPIKGAGLAAQWGVGLVPKQYALLERLALERPSVLVCSAAVLAARILQERRGVPMATLMLQPWMIKSNIAPPLLPPVPLPGGLPAFVGNTYWRLVDSVGDLLIGRSVNRFRRSLGLRRRIVRIFQWWLSPELVIGLFPPWYGPPQPDWWPQIRLAGFGRFDGAAERPAADDGRWAAFCAAGDPPIAFTAGTGMRRPAAFFGAAVEACQRLGRRGILLTKFADQVPPSLSATVIPCAYAPFGELLPMCAALVHHGGVGTVAAALAAGTPQLVTPLAFDQPDNAQRVRRLGAGEALPQSRVNGARLTEQLSKVLTPERRAVCQELAARFGGSDGLDVAAEMVEEMM